MSNVGSAAGSASRNVAASSWTTGLRSSTSTRDHAQPSSQSYRASGRASSRSGAQRSSSCSAKKARTQSAPSCASQRSGTRPPRRASLTTAARTARRCSSELSVCAESEPWCAQFSGCLKARKGNADSHRRTGAGGRKFQLASRSASRSSQRRSLQRPSCGLRAASMQGGRAHLQGS